MSLYLVTGGAGFIGSHLVDALLEAGHEVKVLDNLSTGLKDRVNPKAEFILADLTDLESIKPYFIGVEGVLHTAALPRIPLSIEKPVETAQANIMGTLHVLEAAHHGGVKRVVYSASSSAYGSQEEMPLRPDMPPNPLNPYALHKYIGEKLCKQFSDFQGLETVALRYFNVYGPRMADEGAYVTVISHFKRQRKAGDPLTVAGDGEQTRDFTHVFDVVRANLLALWSDKVGQGEVLNVGAGEQHSINKIARFFGGPIANIPARQGEARHTRADISLTKELLGWEPQIKFDEGLRRLMRDEGMEPAE